MGHDTHINCPCCIRWSCGDCATCCEERAYVREGVGQQPQRAARDQPRGEGDDRTHGDGAQDQGHQAHAQVHDQHLDLRRKRGPSRPPAAQESQPWMIKHAADSKAPVQTPGGEVRRPAAQYLAHRTRFTDVGCIRFCLGLAISILLCKESSSGGRRERAW